MPVGRLNLGSARCSVNTVMESAMCCVVVNSKNRTVLYLLSTVVKGARNRGSFWQHPIPVLIVFHSNDNPVIRRQDW